MKPGPVFCIPSQKFYPGHLKIMENIVLNSLCVDNIKTQDIQTKPSKLACLFTCSLSKKTKKKQNLCNFQCTWNKVPEMKYLSLTLLLLRKKRFFKYNDSNNLCPPPSKGT